MPFSPFFRMALILGLLSAIGPFAIDMYLPALPAIGAALRADVGAVQWSLTAFFLALGVGQLVYGPVSDMVGRRPPLFFGLGRSRWPAWAARWRPTCTRSCCCALCRGCARRRAW